MKYLSDKPLLFAMGNWSLTADRNITSLPMKTLPKNKIIVILEEKILNFNIIAPQGDPCDY